MPHEALFAAVASGNLPAVDQELDAVEAAAAAGQGPAIGELVDDSGMTLAGCAALNRQMGSLDRLHARGINLDAPSREGLTPADIATAMCYSDVLTWLAQHGANMVAEDPSELSPARPAETKPAQNTTFESANLPTLRRALIAAGTLPPELRTPALTRLLWPHGMPQICELFAQSPVPTPLADAVKAAGKLENPLKEQVLHHLLPQQALRMMAEKGTGAELSVAAGAIPSLPLARRAHAARELLTVLALAAVERGEGNGPSDALNVARCLRAASFLPTAEQADVACMLMTPTTRDNFVGLTDEAVREECRKHFEPAIASLPESEQAKWRAALAPPPAEWQRVVAAAAEPGGAAAPRSPTDAAGASRSAPAVGS
jgi:hypothetical protein